MEDAREVFPAWGPSVEVFPSDQVLEGNFVLCTNWNRTVAFPQEKDIDLPFAKHLMKSGYQNGCLVSLLAPGRKAVAFFLLNYYQLQNADQNADY